MWVLLARSSQEYLDTVREAASKVERRRGDRARAPDRTNFALILVAVGAMAAARYV